MTVKAGAVMEPIVLAALISVQISVLDAVLDAGLGSGAGTGCARLDAVWCRVFRWRGALGLEILAPLSRTGGEVVSLFRRIRAEGLRTAVPALWLDAHRYSDCHAAATITLQRLSFQLAELVL